MEQDLKQLFEMKENDMTVPPTLSPELRERIGRQRMVTGGLIAAAALAVVVGGFAGARALSSDEALQPAERDSNASPFVDTWTTTDVDGNTRTMVISATGENAYEVTVHNHLAHVCSGAPSTLTGIGLRILGSGELVIPSPKITCDDGSEPKLEDDLPPPEELLSDLTFVHDTESDILTNYSPLERRRTGSEGQSIYSGITLVWGRSEAENRIGELSGWITYDDDSGIWARNLSSADPTDSVLLSSTPGTPIGWSSDGSELLVVRDNLFALNSDGSETRLTDVSGGSGGGSLSPDGTAFVYAATRDCWWQESCKADDGPASAIYVVDTPGGSPHVLLASQSRRYPDKEGRFETSLQEPRWSPDGSQIAYLDGYGDWGHSLRVMNSDGTGSRVVAENDQTLGAGHVYGLQWSPDGSRLAFSIEDRVYVVGVDGSGFSLVAEDAVEPYWSPDGAYIAYMRPDPETSEGGSLEIVRLDDLKVQNFGAGTSGPWTAELEW